MVLLAYCVVESIDSGSLSLLDSEQRQAAIPFSGQLCQSVDYRRRDYGNRRFAAAGGRFSAGHDMNINSYRRVDDVRWRVAVEVSLFHAAIFECDRARQLSYTETYPSLKLT